MRIACIANINNMMFILCRYLRDEGYDVQLFTLNDEPSHFSPSADAYADDYKAYYTVFPFSKSSLYEPDSIQMLQQQLSDFDFYIGSDIAPAILALCGKKLDVFIPHGSDIYALPFPEKRVPAADKIWWLKEKTVLQQLQKTGIASIDTILFPDEYDIHFPFKNKLATQATYHNTSGPMVYIPQYKDLVDQPHVKTLQHYETFSTLRKTNDLLVFSHSRHNGFNLEGDLAIHQKGNDILIRGFADFIKQNPAINAKLILFEYGINVDASKQLIQESGIVSHIVWMPLMPRKEIMFGLNMSDISCGQFDNSWLTCGVVNETLASDIPLLHYREDDLYHKEYDWLYPLMNANTPGQIRWLLSDYMQRQTFYREQAKKGSEWLEINTVKKPLNIIGQRIQQKEKGSSELPASGMKAVKSTLGFYKRQLLVLKAKGKLGSLFGK